MTIKEVSEQYSLSKDTLRYYEKEGLIGPVLKGSNGQRDYQEENLRQIEFIKCMRSINIPISELKKYMDLYALGDETLESRKEILERQMDSINKQMKDLELAKERLIKKLKLYDEELIKKRKGKS